MNTIFEDRPKSDKEINIILVKRDVAIECAAAVTGFILSIFPTLRTSKRYTSAILITSKTLLCATPKRSLTGYLLK